MTTDKQIHANRENPQQYRAVIARRQSLRVPEPDNKPPKSPPTELHDHRARPKCAR